MPSGFSLFSIGVSLGATFVFTLYHIFRQRDIECNQREYKLDSTSLSSSLTDEIAKDIQNKQLHHSISFLGENAMQTLLNDTFVVIVGCGGVGSHAAHMLIRFGVGHMRFIDFDMVTLSSLNRAPLASRSDVGKLKVNVLAEQCRKIAPWSSIDPCPVLYCKDVAEYILSPPKKFKYVFILDCIDNVPTKVDLLEYCYRHQYITLSSMGAGCKFDPSRIQISDISKTKNDPLARRIRRLLKLRGITSGIRVVHSDERENGIELLPLPTFSKSKQASAEILESPKVEFSDDRKGSPFAVLPEFRARILPVLGTLPAIFGLYLATDLIESVYILERSNLENSLKSVSL